MLTLLLASATLAAQPWAIDRAQVLQWEGKPYLPMGSRIPGTNEEIERAHQNGIRDVVVELAADGTGWTEALTKLEASGMRYMIAITSRAAGASGYVVEPESFRIPGLNGPKTVSLRLPGTQSVLSALVSQRDGEVGATRLIQTPDGQLRETFDAGLSLDHVLLLYPRQVDSNLPDFWGKLDRQRDALLGTLRSIKPGPGLRGVIDPMGRIGNFPNSETQFVPDDPVFRMELQAYLRQKYTTVLTACRTWQISAPNFETFDVMARLVPLWSSMRGIPRLWDPETDTFYNVDQKRSLAWRDIRDVMQSTAANRYRRLVRNIQNVWNVPVLQSWTGWSGPYTIVPEVNGIAVEVDGSQGPAANQEVARAAAFLSSRTQPGILIAAGLKPVTGDNPSGLWDALLRNQASMGVRGWYLAANDPVGFDRMAALAKEAWITSPSPKPVPYPEIATNPADSIPLVGGGQWLPSANDGERLDLGPEFAGYRYSGAGGSFYAIWSLQGNRKVKVRMSSPKEANITTSGGLPVEFKVNKNSVELELTSSPLIIRNLGEPPIPEPTYQLAVAKLAEYFGGGSNEIPNADQEALELKDLLSAFDKSPGLAMTEMAAMLRRLSIALGRFTWIEAENANQHTMSDVAAAKGASGDRVIRAKTMIPSELAPLGARYQFVPHTAGQQVLWMAAKVPESQRGSVTVQMGDRLFRLDEPPVSSYRDGFAWFRLGEIQLTKDPVDMQLFIDSQVGTDLAIDAFVFSPDPFRPDGVRVPLVTLPPKPKEGKKP